MKNEKGITLIALIIYVILMTFVVAGVSAITSSFYTNLNEVDENSKSAVAFSKFNMYFIKDIKSKDVRIESSSKDQIQLSFTDDNEKNETVRYSVQNNSLYRNKVKICDDIKDVKITVDNNTEGRNPSVTVYLKIKKYEKTTTYALEPKA